MTIGNTDKGDAFAAIALVRSLIGVLKEKEILVPDDLEKIIIDAKRKFPDYSNQNYDEAKKQIDSIS